MENTYTISKNKVKILLAFAVIFAFSSVILFSVQPKQSSFHIATYIQRKGEAEATLWSYHAGSLTVIGKNFIEGKLGDNTFTNETAYAVYGSLSTSATAFSDAWKNIPTEITADGLERAEMTYASTGNGVWTLTKQWTASGTHTDVQRVGINWGDTANDSTLVWADTITPVTLNNGDKLTVVATTTASG